MTEVSMPKKNGLLKGHVPSTPHVPDGTVQILANAVNNLEPEKIEYDALQVEQEPCPVYNTFGPNMYVREAHLPAGTFIMGHHHLTNHLTVFVQGKIQKFLDNGLVSLWEAPMMYTAGPGRKSFVVLEDTVWLNIFNTAETDMAELERTLIQKSDTWQSIEHCLDVHDYGFYAMLREGWFDQKELDEITARTEDVVQLPFGTYKCGVNYSPIHGKGVFATAEIEPDEDIGAVKVGQYRTLLGRYLNHSDTPNVAIKQVGNDLSLFALREIPGYRGGELGEELLIDYRKAYSHQGGELCLGVQ